MKKRERIDLRGDEESEAIRVWSQSCHLFSARFRMTCMISNQPGGQKFSSTRTCMNCTSTLPLVPSPPASLPDHHPKDLTGAVLWAVEHGLTTPRYHNQLTSLGSYRRPSGYWLEFYILGGLRECLYFVQNPTSLFFTLLWISLAYSRSFSIEIWRTITPRSQGPLMLSSTAVEGCAYPDGLFASYTAMPPCVTRTAVPPSSTFFTFFPLSSKVTLTPIPLSRPM